MSLGPFLTELLLAFRPGKVQKVINETNLFFVVGLGRSGTVFMSDLLDRASSCCVFHESDQDRRALIEAYASSSRARAYIVSRKKRQIAARIEHFDCATYGEVNSYLRYHVDALRNELSSNVLHLVRNGKAVVRSIMNRSSFLASDGAHTGRLGPKNGDPFLERWASMDRFSRVCWYWASTNRDLLAHHIPLVRLEDITESYSAFCDQVLNVLNIELEHAIWAQCAKQPKNVSDGKGFPAWSEWSSQQQKQFVSICGEIMEELGYNAG